MSTSSFTKAILSLSGMQNEDRIVISLSCQATVQPLHFPTSFPTPRFQFQQLPSTATKSCISSTFHSYLYPTSQALTASSKMAHMSYYCRSRHGWRRIKGFRVNSGRLSVHRLRIRFFDLINLIRKWKRACDRALIALTKSISRSRCSSRSRRDDVKSISRRGLAIQRHCISGSECKLRSFGRSNSFYAEAIADCLEFIKRSALTMEDEGTGNSCRSSDVDGSWGQ